MYMPGLRQGIPPGDHRPDHGARIKAVETLLREGLGRVGEADVPEPRMPTTVAEVEALSWGEMKFILDVAELVGQPG